MKITSKGQVTIPAEIREKAGLLPHTDVEFVMTGKKVFLRRKAKSESIRTFLAERMRGKGTVRMTTDEIMRLTRGA